MWQNTAIVRLQQTGIGYHYSCIAGPVNTYVRTIGQW